MSQMCQMRTSACGMLHRIGAAASTSPGVGDPYYYWCMGGAGMVIVWTLRAPGHAGGGCGSDTGPDGFDGEARSPSGYCEGGSNEFEYLVSP